ncbi:MAG: hypothetical protein GY831_10345, partial [Delftia sp.]|nr:hypothetical protein [Delftia sp.]
QSWTTALQLAQETGHAEGLFQVSLAFGQFLAQEGRTEEGIALVRNAVTVGRQIGHPNTAKAEALLARITA